MAVRSNLRFHTKRTPGVFNPPKEETIVIQFEGRDFVWHGNFALGDHDDEYWPTVSIVIDDEATETAGKEALERLLSAIAFWTDSPAEHLSSGGIGYRDKLGQSFAVAMRRGMGDSILPAPERIDVIDDDDLRRALAFYREGLNCGSLFFSFMAFWNSLDVASSDKNPHIRDWIRQEPPHLAAKWSYYGNPPTDWWLYLKDSSRNAIAHSVPKSGTPLLDPDLATDRERLGRNSSLVHDLAKWRIHHRWDRSVDPYINFWRP